MKINYRIAVLTLLAIAGGGWATFIWAEPDTGSASSETVVFPEQNQDVPGPPVIPAGALKVAPARNVVITAIAPAETELPSTVPEDLPSSRQEPSVVMEWLGPPQARVGRQADYTLVVRNTSEFSVNQVTARVQVPPGINIAATEPKAALQGNMLAWEIGSLQPKQDKNLMIRIIPEGKGILGCQAWVTFTGSSAIKIKVTEPKLAIKIVAPDKVMIGDSAAVDLTVTNPGDGPAEQVKLHVTLSEGLEHARGKHVFFDIGNLAPTESRTVKLMCGTKAGGKQICDAIATAEGDLKTQNRAAMSVVMPSLSVEAIGPKLRYLDRKALYTIRVSNPGDAAATNVRVTNLIPPGFKFVSASDGGRHDFATRTVSWFLGQIDPSQAKEVKFEVVAISLGDQKHKITALAGTGLRAEKDMITHVEGLSSVLLEVMDTEDPIEVGAGTAYEVRITNAGSKTETNIKLICNIPEKMQFKGAQGPSAFHQQGNQILFESLPRLAPRGEAIYRINVKAIAPGNVRFTSQITSTNYPEPVIEMESTRIYQD